MKEQAALHEQIAELVAAAEQVADCRAGDDPFSEWAAAANAITLARMPDTPNPTMATTRTCTELLGEALAMLDRLSAADRRPSHSLDRMYVAAALARVRALEP